MAYSETGGAANTLARRNEERRAPTRSAAQNGPRHMGRLIVILLILIVLGALGLVGYSYSGLMQPEVERVTEPVDLGRD